ncbi:hypothetical protein GCM10027085_33590 [Spirosoma aerophilum]
MPWQTDGTKLYRVRRFTHREINQPEKDAHEVKEGPDKLKTTNLKVGVL